jgi:RNA polymerase sigma factor (sigma-70 family)
MVTNDQYTTITESKGLTTQQWDVYIENQRLVKWAVGKYCRNCSPLVTDELSSIFADKLIDAIKGYDPTKGKFGYFYGKCIRRELHKYIEKSKRYSDCIDTLKLYANDSYVETEATPVEESEQKLLFPWVVDAIRSTAKLLLLSEERTELAIAYYRGERTSDSISRELGITRQAVQKYLTKLRSRSLEYIKRTATPQMGLAI